MESNLPANKMYNLYSLLTEAYNGLESDKKICEEYFKSQAKQGNVASLAIAQLKKQFSASDYFCAVLKKRIGLLSSEASDLMKEDINVMKDFEAIVQKLTNKTYRNTSLYDYANVDEGHTSEAKREILEMEKFAKTLDTMKLTINTIMSEIKKIYETWKSLWNEISLIIINPEVIYDKSIDHYAK